MNEVECIKVYDTVFNRLSMPKVNLRINNRQILEGISQLMNLDSVNDIASVLDKTDKIGVDGVINELKKKYSSESPKLATRQSSQQVLEVVNPIIEEMIGGSADLTPSNNTKTKSIDPIKRNNFGGRFIHYGIREHAMAAAMNGMALHKGIIPYSGTFLIFSDYCRPSIRLAALMGIKVIHVMTHDSIGVGEDGPTHQPVEQIPVSYTHLTLPTNREV